MLASFLRSLCTLFGVILAAFSILCTVLAGSVFAAMTYAFFTEPQLSEIDIILWLRTAVGIPVGVLLSWASIRLANYGRPLRQQARSFTLDRRDREKEERWVPAWNTLMATGSVAALVWCQSSGDVLPRMLWALGGAAGFFALVHGYIFWHELGHLAFGRLAGFQALSIQIGSGPLLWRRVTRRGFWWEWRFWPSRGFAQVIDREARPVAWRFLVFIAGGPLVGGLFLALALYVFFEVYPLEGVLPTRAMRGIGPVFGLLPFWILLAPAIVCLLPYTAKIGGQAFHSDGWWLCRGFFLPGATYREKSFHGGRHHWQRLREAGFHEQARAEKEYVLTRFPQRRATLALHESLWHHRRKESPEAEVCFQQGLDEAGDMEPLARALTLAEYAAALTLADDPDAARTACAAILARTSEAEQARQLDAFACIPIYYRGTSALLDDAERWCAQALERSPDEVTLRGTRGSILFEQGRVEEAVAMLREVLATTASDEDRGIASFYLALAARQGGHRREMKSLRAQALRWCKVPAMVGRIRTELRPV